MDMSGLDTEREIQEMDARERRRRRFGRAVGVWMFVIAVGLALALLPRIASLPGVRDRLVARLNASIMPISVTVDDWHLSWFGEQRLKGLRLADPSQGLTVTIPAVTLSRGLVRLIPIGTVDAGVVTLDQPVVRLIRVKPVDRPVVTPAVKAQALVDVRAVIPAERPVTLPRIALLAQLVVRNGRAVADGFADGETVLAERVNATLRLDTWDKPLTLEADGVVPGEGGDGSMAVEGELPTPRSLMTRAFEDPATVGRLHVAAKGLDVRMARPLLEARTGAAWGVGGVLDAEVSVRAAGLRETAVEAEVAIRQFTFAFPGCDTPPPGDVTVTVSATRDIRGVEIRSCDVQTPWARMSADGRFGVLTPGAVPTGRIAVTGGVDVAAVVRDFGFLLGKDPGMRADRGTLSFTGVITGTERARSLRFDAAAEDCAVFYNNERVPLVPSPRVTFGLVMPYTEPIELTALDIVLPFARISGAGRLDSGLISGQVDLSAFSRDYRTLWMACPPMVGQLRFQIAAAQQGQRSEVTATIGVEDLAAEIGTGKRIAIARADNQLALSIPMVAGRPSMDACVAQGTFTSAVRGLDLKTHAWAVTEPDARAAGAVEVAFSDGFLHLSDLTLTAAAARMSVPTLRFEWPRKGRAASVTGDASAAVDLGIVSGWRRVSREGVEPPRMGGQAQVQATAEKTAAGTRITGGGSVTNLVMAAAGGGESVREERIVVSAAAVLTPDGQTLRVESARMTTGWLTATAKGRVRDVPGAAQAVLSGTLEVDYDALSAKWVQSGVRAVTFAGKPGPRPFEFSGGLRAGVASLRSFGTVEGALGIGEVRILGLKLATADAAFGLDEGLLTVEYQPVSGSGAVRLKPLLQVAAAPPVLEIGGVVPILDRVPLTQEFTDTVLAMLNPLLRGCVAGSGLVELNVAETRIPLAPGVQQQLDLQFTVTLREATFTPTGTLAEALDLAGIESRTMRIEETTIRAICRNGRIQSEPFELNLDGHRVRFRGSVGLDQTVSYLVELPLTEKLVGRSAWPHLKGMTVRVPVGGTLTHLELDKDAAKKEIGHLLKEAATRALGDAAKQQLNRLLRER